MRLEWEEHNALYLILPGELKERAKHVDLDINADGTPQEIWNYWIGDRF